MAKGWESKAVEAQVEEAQAQSGDKRKRQSTPEQTEEYRRREVLLLARTRVQRDLKASQNPRYTDQLTRALADIEAQLAKLKNVESD